MSQATQLQSNSQRWRALVLEDDQTLADEICAVLLGFGGCECARAASVVQAQQRFGAQAPQLVVIDHRLLGTKNGSDFAAWLCADPIRAQTFRISYSSSQRSDVLTVEPEHGPLFHAIVAKSLNHANLIATVRQWMATQSE